MSRRGASRALAPSTVAVAWAVLAATLCAQPAPRIAAAASLSGVLTELAAQFQQERGQRVDLVFGASGALTRQILEGAPFDAFLAADEEFPDKLAAAGLTRGPGVVYAIGRLALFVPAGSPLTADARLAGLAALLASGGQTRFAIANPDVAPYGQAARAVLRKYGLWEAIRPHLVLGDSVAQATQFASSGNAVGGLVAYSLVIAPAVAGKGTSLLIADGDYPPLRQKMVLLERAGDTAARFYAFLQTPAARATLRKHGFAVPE